ncbi:hypothetical protein DFP72DRAFT_851973 [Ephemerocybe angulata]|uniref:Uncharacterized protein n=1 Tax=Ephemerocybe angulata TaxID=980116 RepID=A0A8H6HPJ2_9AGAR|nr:hypothetical protein DFP72DRAFT_851973 [Tulosesus angulatus]
MTNDRGISNGRSNKDLARLEHPRTNDCPSSDPSNQHGASSEPPKAPTLTIQGGFQGARLPGGRTDVSGGLDGRAALDHGWRKEDEEWRRVGGAKRTHTATKPTTLPDYPKTRAERQTPRLASERSVVSCGFDGLAALEHGWMKEKGGKRMTSKKPQESTQSNELIEPKKSKNDPKTQIRTQNPTQNPTQNIVTNAPYLHHRRPYKRLNSLPSTKFGNVISNRPNPNIGSIMSRPRNERGDRSLGARKWRRGSKWKGKEEGGRKGRVRRGRSMRKCVERVWMWSRRGLRGRGRGMVPVTTRSEARGRTSGWWAWTIVGRAEGYGLRRTNLNDGRQVEVGVFGSWVEVGLERDVGRGGEGDAKADGKGEGHKKSEEEERVLTNDNEPRCSGDRRELGGVAVGVDEVPRSAKYLWNEQQGEISRDSKQYEGGMAYNTVLRTVNIMTTKKPIAGKGCATCARRGCSSSRRKRLFHAERIVRNPSSLLVSPGFGLDAGSSDSSPGRGGSNRIEETALTKTMRVSFINLLTALGALASLATAYRDDYTFAARDYLDELTTSTRSLDRREMLADIAIRDLLDELADRLEARAPGDQIQCSSCSMKFPGTSEGHKQMTGILQVLGLTNYLASQKVAQTSSVHLELRSPGLARVQIG